MEAHLNDIEYRVVLIDPASRGVLMHAEGASFRLLRISIPVGTRIAQQLGSEMLRIWHMGIIILDFLSIGGGGAPCVAAQLVATETPFNLVSVPAEEIPTHELSDQERTHLRHVLGNNAASPFSRIGWIYEAIAWAESMTGHRVRPKSGIEQYNAGGGFMLLHLSMTGEESYWLKATGVPNTHERQMTRSLSTLCPTSLPDIVAEKSEWNAWLMKDDGCCVTSLPTCPHDLVSLLGQAVKSLAELQLKTIDEESLLFSAGAFDQRPHVLRTYMDELFAYIDEAMLFQTSTKVARIETRRLQEILKVLNGVCDHIERLDIPSAILHGDLNLGNLVFTDGRCQFIDWCEGYVGHPLVTFQHLLLLNSAKDPAIEDALKEIYKVAMHPVCDPRQMEEGFVYMGLFAALSTLYGRGDWLCNESRNDPRRRGYVRCIARHMDRYARDPSLLATIGI